MVILEIFPQSTLCLDNLTLCDEKIKRNHFMHVIFFESAVYYKTTSKELEYKKKWIKVWMTTLIYSIRFYKFWSTWNTKKERNITSSPRFLQAKNFWISVVSCDLMVFGQNKSLITTLRFSQTLRQLSNAISLLLSSYAITKIPTSEKIMFLFRYIIDIHFSGMKTS